jgi:hypothetical protein
MDTTPVYVLVTLDFTRQGDVCRKNVGVTFNIHEAEAHESKDVSNEYDTFTVPASWREGAAISETVMFMREAAEMVRIDIERSLA